MAKLKEPSNDFSYKPSRQSLPQFSKVDKNNRDSLFSPVVMPKHDFYEPFREQTTDLVNVIEDFFESASLPPEQRVLCLSEAFLKLHQRLEHGVEFLSQEELNAPPSVSWRDRDKSKKQTPVEHLEDQYASRMHKGLEFRNIRISDFPLYQALQNWKGRSENELPSWLVDSKKNDVVSMSPLEAYEYIKRHRSSSKVATAKIKCD
ncbi:MAG: hypothetical protein ACRBBQ_12360 [Cognatishimia sp.]